MLCNLVEVGRVYGSGQISVTDQQRSALRRCMVQCYKHYERGDKISRKKCFVTLEWQLIMGSKSILHSN